MIGMRYHLLSLAAVLLALAAGVALGTGPLNETVDAALGSEQLQQEKAGLVGELARARSAAQVDRAYLDGIAPTVLAGQLDGVAVLVVSLPGAAAADADAVRAAVAAADGTVTGVVGLTEALLDPDQQQVLDGLLDRLSDAELPTGSVPARAAAALAGALVTDEPAGAELAETDRALLTGLTEVGVLVEPVPVTGRAGAVVVVAPDLAEPPAAEAQNALLSALGEAAAGTLLAAPVGSAEPGGSVAAMRADRALVEAVASLDAVDVAAGPQIAVGGLRTALTDQIGQYGTGPATTTAVPPAPAPTR